MPSNTSSGYETNIPLHGLEFTSTPKHNNIELKFNIKNYTRKLRLAEFFQNKKGNNSEEDLFSKTIYFYSILKQG